MLAVELLLVLLEEFLVLGMQERQPLCLFVNMDQRKHISFFKLLYSYNICITKGA